MDKIRFTDRAYPPIPRTYKDLQGRDLWCGPPAQQLYGCWDGMWHELRHIASTLRNGLLLKLIVREVGATIIWNKLICNHGTSWNIMEHHGTSWNALPFNLHKLSIPLDIYSLPSPPSPWPQCACIATVPCVWGRQQRSCLGWGSWSVLTGPFRKLVDDELSPKVDSRWQLEDDPLPKYVEPQHATTNTKQTKHDHSSPQLGAAPKMRPQVAESSISSEWKKSKQLLRIALTGMI